MTVLSRLRFAWFDRLFGRPAPALSPGGVEDAPRLASLHAAAFRRGWSMEEFERLLIEPNAGGRPRHGGFRNSLRLLYCRASPPTRPRSFPIAVANGLIAARDWRANCSTFICIGLPATGSIRCIWKSTSAMCRPAASMPGSALPKWAAAIAIMRRKAARRSAQRAGAAPQPVLTLSPRSRRSNSFARH